MNVSNRDDLPARNSMNEANLITPSSYSFTSTLQFRQIETLNTQWYDDHSVNESYRSSMPALSDS